MTRAMTTQEMRELWLRLHKQLKVLNAEEEAMEYEDNEHWEKRVSLEIFLSKLGRMVRMRKYLKI
jgi:hypothetical protein